MANRIRVPIVLILMTIAILLMPGCDGDGNDIPCTNPLDSECPDYVELDTKIVAGPDSGATVISHTVSFTYRASNDNVSYFAYRLTQSRWSDWSDTTDTTVTFQLLDEGLHQFEVKARYSAEDGDDTPAISPFVIDAIKGPGIRLQQRRFSVAVGDTFVAIVFIEEVDSLKGVLAELAFNPDSLTFIRGEIYTDHSSILMSNAAGRVISKFTPNSAAGTVKMEAATTTGDPPYVSGTGPIGQVTFQALQAGITRLRFLESTELRNANNETIENVEKVQSLVEIRPQ